MLTLSVKSLRLFCGVVIILTMKLNPSGGRVGALKDTWSVSG